MFRTVAVVLFLSLAVAAVAADDKEDTVKKEMKKLQGDSVDSGAGGL